MKLFLISQTQNDNYETYDSAVVAAPDYDSAKVMHPSNGKPIKVWGTPTSFSSWCYGPEHVTVRYIGEAASGVEHGVVCASFNAG